MLMLRQDSLASRMARKSFVTTWCSVKANWYLQYVPLQETFVFCTIAIERRTVYARTITVPDNPSPLLSLKFFTQTNNSHIYIYTYTYVYTYIYLQRMLQVWSEQTSRKYSDNFANEIPWPKFSKYESPEVVLIGRDYYRFCHQIKVIAWPTKG